ncbi:MAG: hypothetical protein EBZ48_06790 [Proteobacteria bacterium]|nr:hypothetical protein [Pseudomonadota bacterium]
MSTAPHQSAPANTSAEQQPDRVNTPKGIALSMQERFSWLLREHPLLHKNAESIGTGSLMVLPDLSLHRALHAEQLLVVCDPVIDPVLYRWLDTHVTAARASHSETERVEALLAAVAKTFAPSTSFLPRPRRQRQFQQITENAADIPILLGELIQTRIGVCRHIAPLLQLAFQKASIPSAMAYGNVSRREVGFDEKLSEAEPHMWNIALADGVPYAVDPMNRIFEPISTLETSALRAQQLLKRASETQVVVRAAGGFLSGDTCTVLCPSQTALSGPLYMNETMIPLFIKATERAHKRFNR